jgi:actin-related protein 8
MEKVQIIPPPKDVDPRVLVWKGGCVLAKMDSINDMWVTPSDWVSVHISFFSFSYLFDFF